MRYQKTYSFIITICLLLGMLSVARAATNLDVTLTVPEGATPRVLHQIKNYYQEEIPYSLVDGNVYTYSLPASGTGYTYKVNKPGEVTQAGYFDLTSVETASQIIDFSEQGTPSTYEASLVTNVGAHLSKHMAVGDTFRVRTYRTWQIINTMINNIMIEPEFHYNIISGDAVTLTQNSFNSAWADITAVKEGISIVEMYYDPIVVKNGTTYTYYKETDSQRIGRFAIIVGDAGSIDLGLDAWDSEANTVYFTGDGGSFTFTPNDDVDGISVNGVAIASDNGMYTASIVEGNNIIEAHSADKTEIAIIKGVKLSITTVSVGTAGVGKTLNVKVKGLYTPVYKMSGIYNPTAVTINYSDSAAKTVSTKLKQYASCQDIALTTTINENGDVVISDGYLSSTMWGSTWGLHRGITDSGVDPNFNAQSLSGKFGQLPNLTLATLFENGDYVIYGTVPTVFMPNKNIFVVESDGDRPSTINVYNTTKAKRITSFDEIFVWDENNAPIINKITK